MKIIENDFRLLKSFRGNNEGSFLLYLKKITISKTKDYLKSKNHRKTDFIEDDEDLTSYQIETFKELFNPVEEYKNKECKEIIDIALSSSKLYYREVIIYYLKGYTLEEISNILQEPFKTIQTRFLRAKEQLKSQEILKDFFR